MMNNQMSYNPYVNMGQQTHPNMNLNYVTMQNNYFFAGMPQEGMGYNPNPMYAQYPFMGNMNQGLSGNQIETEKGGNQEN